MKWIEYNNRVVSGETVRPEYDQMALKSYFEEGVNPNTVFFHDLEEKLDYMTTKGFWDKNVLARYSTQDIKRVFKAAYDVKFRFESFMGAYKFYNEYALKTPDKSRWLERYEDRMSMVALTHGKDVEHALSILDEIINQRFTPATPTLMNSGRANAGRLVSCFEGDSLVDTIEGQVRIDSISEGDLVLTHTGEYKKVLGVTKRLYSGDLYTLGVEGKVETLTSTSEHPLLVERKHNDKRESLIKKDGYIEGINNWLEASSVKLGDRLATSYIKPNNSLLTIDVLDYISENVIYPGVHVVEPTEDGTKLRVSSSRLKNKEGNVDSWIKPINRFIDINEDFGRLVGYFLSEGYVMKRTHSGKFSGVRFTFGTKEESYIADCISLGYKIFGITPSTKQNKDGSTNVDYNSTHIGTFFHTIFGTGFSEKHIPLFLIQDTNEEFLKGILIGTYRGDGCTKSDGMTLLLTNPSLVKSLQDVANSIQVITNRTLKITNSGKLGSVLNFSDSYDTNSKLIVAIDKNLTNLREREKYLKRTSLHANTMYRRVKEVSTVHKNDILVYNLEVEDHHTYSVNGYIVHNCFLLSSCTDNAESIMKTLEFTANLSSNGGGIGILLDNIRATGEPMRGVENVTKGVVAVAKLFDNNLRYFNQSGMRLGAGAVYLSVLHPDFLDLLAAKKPATDEDKRLKTLSIGAIIPDVFMEKVKQDEYIYQFYPYSLYQETGREFTDIDWSKEYEALAENPNIRKVRVSARKIYEDIAIAQGESGYPYILYIDTANKANPIPNVASIKMSNLC